MVHARGPELRREEPAVLPLWLSDFAADQPLTPTSPSPEKQPMAAGTRVDRVYLRAERHGNLLAEPGGRVPVRLYALGHQADAPQRGLRHHQSRPASVSEDCVRRRASSRCISITDFTAIGPQRASHDVDAENTPEAAGAFYLAERRPRHQDRLRHAVLPVQHLPAGLSVGHLFASAAPTRRAPTLPTASATAGYGLASALLGAPDGGSFTVGPSLALLADQLQLVSAGRLESVPHAYA